MLLTILVIFLTLIILLVLHELGHFILAKKFGVKVEEFGIGYPPRIFGKKFGETIYSINLLPFGAFVKITGEEGDVDDPRSFSKKPLWQRGLIILGGVVSFWIIAFLIFSLIAGVWGLPHAVSDDFQGGALSPQVQIIEVAKDSPAETAGIKVGDKIIELKAQGSKLKINKVKEIQEFTDIYKGKEIVLTLKRAEEFLDVSLIPRISPPEGEGAIGIGLVRVAKIKYPWYQAPYIGAKVTFQQTWQIPVVLGTLFQKFLKGEKVQGVQLVGPIGIGKIMGQSLKLGIDNFLMIVGMIAVWLALFNALPIPALDGGKFLFLVIEGIRKKPISQEIEQKITVSFFLVLILLMIFVTVKDVIGLF